MAPPPVASTISSCALSSRIISASRWRKLSSPSISKMIGMDAPVRDSISWSESTKRLFNFFARARPMVVLPAPIRPTRKMLPLILELISSISMSANDPVWEVVQGASRSQGWFPWQAAQRSNTPKQDVPEGLPQERALAVLHSLRVAPPRDASHALPAPFLGATHLTAIYEMSSIEARGNYHEKDSNAVGACRRHDCLILCCRTGKPLAGACARRQYQPGKQIRSGWWRRCIGSPERQLQDHS